MASSAALTSVGLRIPLASAAAAAAEAAVAAAGRGRFSASRAAAGALKAASEVGRRSGRHVQGAAGAATAAVAAAAAPQETIASLSFFRRERAFLCKRPSSVFCRRMVPQPPSNGLFTLPPLSSSLAPLRSTSSSSEGSPSAPSLEDMEEEDLSGGMGGAKLQHFCELNSGKWKGEFWQFDLEGRTMQKVVVTTTGVAYGKGELASLQQTLRILAASQKSNGVSRTESNGAEKDDEEWVECKLPEINRDTVVSRQYVGFFEEERAYAMSHVTAQALGKVLRVGVLGVDYADDDDDDVPASGSTLRLPSRRPALVSEVCLLRSAPDAPHHPTPQIDAERVRAFHVLDARGVIDTIGIFLESSKDSLAQSSSSSGGGGDGGGVVSFRDVLVGEWEGVAKTVRSELYGGTTEELKVSTRCTYAEDDKSLTVEHTRGARTVKSRAGVMSDTVVLFDGGLQTTVVPELGMAFSYPRAVPRGNAFFLEFMWASCLSERRRVVRTFDPDGLVVSTTLIEESRVMV